MVARIFLILMFGVPGVLMAWSAYEELAGIRAGHLPDDNVVVPMIGLVVGVLFAGIALAGIIRVAVPLARGQFGPVIVPPERKIAPAEPMPPYKRRRIFLFIVLGTSGLLAAWMLGTIWGPIFRKEGLIGGLLLIEPWKVLVGWLIMSAVVFVPVGIVMSMLAVLYVSVASTAKLMLGNEKFGLDTDPDSKD